GDHGLGGRVAGDQRCALNREAEGTAQLRQQADIAGRLVAEPELLPDHEDRGVQVLHQHVVHERLGRELGEVQRERDDAEHVHAELLDQLRLAGRLGEDRRVRPGSDHFGRMRVEGDHDGRDAEVSGPFHGVADRALVSTVDTVEHPDGDHGPTPPGRRRLDPTPPLHQLTPAGRRTTSGRARPSRSDTIASTSPSGPNTAYGPSMPTVDSGPPCDTTFAASWSTSRRGKARATACSNGSVTGSSRSASSSRVAASARLNPPTAVRRRATRWPPTPSATPRSRAIART